MVLAGRAAYIGDVTRDHFATTPAARGVGVDSGPAHRVPGRQTLVEASHLAGPVGRAASGTAVQRAATAGAPAGPGASDAVQAAAERGTSGAAGTLPHFDRIQMLFGRHDVSGVRAYVGGPAAEGAAAMGAQAFATGDQVAFRGAPDLHTAAHEAAHVVQQRAGVHLKGGVGEQGDAHERHADAVADAVVRGESSEALLDQYAGRAAPAAVAHKAVQRLVINLDPGDKVITRSAEIHKHRDDEQAKILNEFHGEERSNPDTAIITGEVGSKEDTPPLHKIAPDESISILAHGTPAMGRDEPRVAGKTAAELVAHLIKMGLTPKHTGIINLSNCTSAWDRKSTGSFLDRFVKLLKAKGHTNFVTGYESFTDSADEDHEVEVPHDKRELFLAHKVTERYMMRLMNLRPEDGVDNGGAALEQIHAELLGGAKDAQAEARDFSSKNDEESVKLKNYYIELSGLLLSYLADADGKVNERLTSRTNEVLLELMTKYKINNMGAVLHQSKTEAIPVVAGGEG
jgi:hypothetical protein